MQTPGQGAHSCTPLLSPAPQGRRCYRSPALISLLPHNTEPHSHDARNPQRFKERAADGSALINTRATCGMCARSPPAPAAPPHVGGARPAWRATPPPRPLHPLQPIGARGRGLPEGNKQRAFPHVRADGRGLRAAGTAPASNRHSPCEGGAGPAPAPLRNSPPACRRHGAATSESGMSTGLLLLLLRFLSRSRCKGSLNNGRKHFMGHQGSFSGQRTQHFVTDLYNKTALPLIIHPPGLVALLALLTKTAPGLGCQHPAVPPEPHEVARRC